MKIKLLLLTLLVVFTITMGACSSMCGSAPGNNNSNANSNANAATPTPVATATPMATPTLTPTPGATPVGTPTSVTGIAECDDLFAKFEAWAAEKNKNGSKAEKAAVAILKITLIGELKKKIDKMKPGDREKIAGSCSLAAIQFEQKQRALEADPNANMNVK